MKNGLRMVGGGGGRGRGEEKRRRIFFFRKKRATAAQRFRGENIAHPPSSLRSLSRARAPPPHRQTKKRKTGTHSALNLLRVKLGHLLGEFRRLLGGVLDGRSFARDGLAVALRLLRVNLDALHLERLAGLVGLASLHGGLGDLDDLEGLACLVDL